MEFNNIDNEKLIAQFNRVYGRLYGEKQENKSAELSDLYTFQAIVDELHRRGFHITREGQVEHPRHFERPRRNFHPNREPLSLRCELPWIIN